MAPDLKSAIETLRAAVVDSRAENVRYRQNELFSLHAALRENADAICEAIAKDAASSTTKAQMEFFLAMDAVRKSYESLDFDKSLKEEYSVKYGKDNVGRRAALGLVAIRPSKHSRFYSVLTPLAAALEAGNCVILELDQSSPAVDTVLTDLFRKAFYRDTVYVSTSKFDEENLSEIDFFVDQVGSSASTSTKSLLSPQMGTISVLDRTGTLELAAKSITTARMTSGTTSPYSPSLVLVNEYVKDAFVAGCLKQASNLGPTSKIRTISAKEQEQQKLLTRAEEKGEIVIHRSESTDLSIVEVRNRSSNIAQMNLAGPHILLLSTTSLMDSVNSQRSSPTFLASSIFASPSASKFLAEQIPSHAAYVNHIPDQLLVGPASPATHPHALHPRYTSNMFSSPRPQFVTPAESLPSFSKLKELALKELKPTGQPVGHAVGFFEQGILLGLASTAIIVLPLLGWSLFTAGKHSWRFVGARWK